MRFLVDYSDSDGVKGQTSFKADTGKQHRRQVVVQICKRLKADGYIVQQITCIPGDYSLAELELMCKKGSPQCFLPLHITCGVVKLSRSHCS